MQWGHMILLVPLALEPLEMRARRSGERRVVHALLMPLESALWSRNADGADEQARATSVQCNLR